MSEGATLRDSKQPAPASDPVVNEGGADYNPDNEVDVRKSEPIGSVGGQELDGISKDNIIEGETTRGNEVDYAAKEDKADQAVEQAIEANDGTSRVAQ